MASDYLGAFDKLLNAYGRIATTLPRIKELGEAFKDSPALLPKLAAYYADILAFHHSAYKFVTRKCRFHLLVLQGRLTLGAYQWLIHQAGAYFSQPHGRPLTSDSAPFLLAWRKTAIRSRMKLSPLT